MASKLCAACHRTMQGRSRPISRSVSSSLNSYRAISTTPSRRAELPEPNATAATSIPPVTPTRTQSSPKSTSPSTISMKAATELRKLAGGSTETYTAYGATENLYKECARQAIYSIPKAKDQNAEMPKTLEGEDLGVGEGVWHTDMGLKPTFSTWSQVTMLHMYLLSARFRCFAGTHSQPYQQHLLDHFFHDAENLMIVNHNMHARGTRNKYLKDLFVQWRGLLAAYDEGLAKGDAVLAGAVWRNVFKASEEVDAKALAQIVSYMRRELKNLDEIPNDKVMMGQIEFRRVGPEGVVVARRSKMMDLPFDKAPGPDLHTRENV